MIYLSHILVKRRASLHHDRAPTRLAWCNDNRTTSFRVVGEKESTRIEVRVPGADCNFYLALAALIGMNKQALSGVSQACLYWRKIQSISNGSARLNLTVHARLHYCPWRQGIANNNEARIRQHIPLTNAHSVRTCRHARQSRPRATF